MLPANVDQRPSLQRGLMNFQLQNFQRYNKLLKDWFRGKQLILFSSNLNVFRGEAGVRSIAAFSSFLCGNDVGRQRVKYVFLNRAN